MRYRFIIRVVKDALTVKLGQAEIERLRLEMLARRLTSAGLAEKSGINIRVIQNLLAGNNHCWPPRRAINISLKRRIFINPPRPGAPKSKTQRTKEHEHRTTDAN